MMLFKSDNKFTIIGQPNLFKDDVYPVSYKLVILRSIWHSYHHKGNAVSVAKVLSDMQNVLAQNSFIYIKKCLELYSFAKEYDFGLVLVDRSKACYPLLFYPADDLPEHGNRVDALKVVLHDLYRNHEFFDDLLRRSPKWNTELVNLLKEKFTNPTPKSSKKN